MKRHFFSFFFLVVLVNALLVLTNLKQIYDNCLLTVHNHYLTSVANVRNSINRSTRQCSKVINIEPASSDWNQVVAAFKSRQPGFITATRGMLKRDNWILAEVELSNGIPTILLFKQPLESILDIQAYNATATPYVNAPVIRDYFLQREASVPRDLIECYDPIGYPFNEQPQTIVSKK